jgi:glycerate 2-kinase
MTAASVFLQSRSLRDDALAIWRAAVAAVDSELLVRRVVHKTTDTLTICGNELPLNSIGRICVVGGGKAGAGMAAALEAELEPDLLDRLDGWVNVPDDCVHPLRKITLHGARPPGQNEPTERGVIGTRRILERVGALETNDLCVVLLSGGGSALLPAPVPEVSLKDMQHVTRQLSRAGAGIEALNCVRRQLSQIKGGGLARACRAGTLICLIISDVIGDPLETIASGPTIESPDGPADALSVLQKYLSEEQTPAAVLNFLQKQAVSDSAAASAESPQPGVRVLNHVIGNNRVAIDAAAVHAAKLGYRVVDLGSDIAGVACDVGADLVERCLSERAGWRPEMAPVCLLSGGEPVVDVVPTDRPQKGGRNQELVLAGAVAAWEDGLRNIALLSGGTDGEDGPTDAAGAVADTLLIEQARSLNLVPQEFLRWNNAYPFFEQAGGLIKTGPTHTNVMDVRVALIGDITRGPA